MIRVRKKILNQSQKIRPEKDLVLDEPYFRQIACIFSLQNAHHITKYLVKGGGGAASFVWQKSQPFKG